MSLWWFLSPLVLLIGAVVAAVQVRGIRRQGEQLKAQTRRVDDLQPLLVRVRSDVEELRASLRENPRK